MRPVVGALILVGFGTFMFLAGATGRLAKENEIVEACLQDHGFVVANHVFRCDRVTTP